LDILPGLFGPFDLILADLPYGTTACKWDTVIPFEPLWEQYKRLIKRKGAVVLFGSQPFTSALVMSNVEWFKYCWVWEKGRGTGYQIAKIKPLCSHEDIAVFGQSRLIYNPQMRPRDKPRLSKNNGSTRQMLVSDGKPYTADKPLTERYPVTVLHFGNDNQAAKVHPTQKPVALLEYLIRTYTHPGETVLDNVMGSGSTGVACVNTGRKFVGIEKEPEYFEIAQQRIEAAQQEMVQVDLPGIERVRV
jgi:site-specific DNA-methyltransferase (adenine-specific)